MRRTMLKTVSPWSLAALLVAAYRATSFAQDGEPKATTTKAAATKAPENKKSEGPASPDYGLPQVRRINQEIRQVWTDHQLQPSPPAGDGEWCRRVYLDVIGRVP